MNDYEARVRSEKWDAGSGAPTGDTVKLIEAAYRRGFQQGAAEALYATEDGVGLEDVARWVHTTLRRWRYDVPLTPRDDAPHPATMPRCIDGWYSSKFDADGMATFYRRTVRADDVHLIQNENGAWGVAYQSEHPVAAWHVVTR